MTQWFPSGYPIAIAPHAVFVSNTPYPEWKLTLPRSAIDLHQRVRQVLQHTSPMLPEANCPIQHFERSVNIGPLLISYIDDHIAPETVYEAVYDRHLGHLRRM